MAETRPGEVLGVPEMRAMWRKVLDGMCADGCDPIDASEAMLAEALRAKLQIDGPERVAAVMEAYVAHLRKNAREINAAIAGARPVAH